MGIIGGQTALNLVLGVTLLKEIVPSYCDFALSKREHNCLY